MLLKWQKPVYKWINFLLLDKLSILHAHPTLQNIIDYAQKIGREFLLLEGIQ